ncbi:MAG: ABC transporter ATP-binding protein [Candidatus Wallbacteria bacterium]|nr:ABC transporter ATP-binding protein [Candidatus Wallbacteria bacterium]
MEALSVRDLRKSYGKIEAVKGVSFDVRQGEIFALIGPNGAGKSTTLKIIATLLTPGSGTIMVCDTDLARDPSHIRELISYLPEESGAYKNLTGRAYLKFMAALFSCDKAAQNQFVATAERINGLNARLSDKIRTYSKGMTRKLLLSRALMTRPRLAILDEPTSGLDVLNALDIRRIIREFAAEGVSILLSSHNMLEIEFLSDRVAIMDKGVIYETGTPDALKEKYGVRNLEEVFARVVA